MRIVFMGTPDFAAVSLKRLYEDGHDVAGVFTRPDKPKNRGMKTAFSPVKELALERGTPVFQPVTLKDDRTTGILRSLDCGLVAVVAYGIILPADVLILPEYGCVNIHGSLLPKYRGAAPVQWAVINGECETGVTSIFMAEGIDDGDIINMEKTPVYDNETAGELAARLSIMGAGLLSKTIESINNGRVGRIPQDHASATYAPLISKKNCPIDWTDTAFAIKAKVRGLNPWPVATAILGDELVKVFAVDAARKPTGAVPGVIVSAGDPGLEIACSDGTVSIRELQAPGGKRMGAAEYLRGRHKSIINKTNYKL